MGPRRRVWFALGAAVLLLAALIEVRVTGPRVHVRWAPSHGRCQPNRSSNSAISLVNGRREAVRYGAIELGDSIP